MTIPTTPTTFPIFPLPSALLVPGAFLPLHIFEPRYRSMLADAMAGERHFAMAMPLPVRPQDDAKRPRVHPVVGLGRVVHHRPYPDGRADIVLAGVARMRVVREIVTGRPYRTVEAEPLPDVESAAHDLLPAARALLDRLTGLDAEDRERLRDQPAGRLLDAVLVRLGLPPREQHRIHSNPRVADRLAEIERALARIDGVIYPAEIGPGDPRRN